MTCMQVCVMIGFSQLVFCGGKTIVFSTVIRLRTLKLYIMKTSMIMSVSMSFHCFGSSYSTVFCSECFFGAVLFCSGSDIVQLFILTKYVQDVLINHAFVQGKQLCFVRNLRLGFLRPHFSNVLDGILMAFAGVYPFFPLPPPPPPTTHTLTVGWGDIDLISSHRCVSNNQTNPVIVGVTLMSFPADYNNNN